MQTTFFILLFGDSKNRVWYKELLCQLSTALEWMLIGGDYWSGKLLRHVNLQRVMTQATELLVSYPDHEQQTDNMQQHSMVLTAENAVTNQIQDNKNTSPIITNFERIDSTIPKMEMIFNLYQANNKMVHSNAINIQKTLFSATKSGLKCN